MATKKFTDFPLIGNVAATDLILVVRNGVTYRALGLGASGSSSPQAYRAYRLRFDSTQSMSYASIAEIEFREAAGVQQTSSGGAAFSTATGNGTVAGAAFNGDLTDRWVGDYPDKPFPKYVGYIFSSAKTIVEVMLAASQGYPQEAPLTYGIEASSDTTSGFDGTWVEIAKVATATNWTSGEKRTVSLAASGGSTSGSAAPVTATYWRVRWLLPNGGSAASIAAIEMAATAGGADQCTGGTPTSSSFFAGYANVYNAFDGDNSSYWQSSGGRSGVNEWAQYQFAAPVSVAELRLTPAPNSENGPTNAPAMFALDYSKDGKSFKNAMLGQYTDWTGGGKQAFTVSA